MTQKERFDSTQFHDQFFCDLPLGSFCSPRGTVFRLWAPTASEVALHLYDNGTFGGLLETVLLPRGEKGVWTYETLRNLDGVYYDFDVTVDGIRRRTADPYARACGLNGNRSMVLDLRRTDPKGWSEDKAPARQPEDIIYEIHVKDFSWDPAGGADSRSRGKYLALCRADTTLNGDGVHPTGVNYLKRLGVTHVQLMPVYDFGSVDEAGDPDSFNWGYDPVNYNVPEGSYATDPTHGEVRVRELKQAIQSLHQNGLRVIMDVVYNHTYRLDSWLWRTVPWYYYRQKADGTESNGSGCGSEIASERSMCAQYILDSVLYWAEEYHMDGFRFDLMGILDANLMNRIQKALDEKYGEGEKLLYGEPWAGGQTSDASAPSATPPGTPSRATPWTPVPGALSTADPSMGPGCGPACGVGPMSHSRRRLRISPMCPPTTIGPSGTSWSTPWTRPGIFRASSPRFCGPTGWRLPSTSAVWAMCSSCPARSSAGPRTASAIPTRRRCPSTAWTGAGPGRTVPWWTITGD